MTLAEWIKLTGESATDHAGGAVSVHRPRVESHRPLLWHLADYAVSTVSGPVVWLVPKTS